MFIKSFGLIGVCCLLGSSIFAAIPVVQDLGLANPNDVTVVVGEPVDLQIEATNEPTSFSATGLPPGFSIDPTTGLISGSFSAANTASINVSATNSDGTGNRTFILRGLPRAVDYINPTSTLEAAVDTGLIRFTEIGTNFPAFWQGRGWSQAPHSNPGVGMGTTFLASRRLQPNNARNNLRTFIQGPAIFTFAWGGNTESGFDPFVFYVNNQEVGRISGFNPFADVTVTLGPGLNQLDWIFFTDISLGNGGSCWLDNFRIQGYPQWAVLYGLGAFNSGFEIDKEKDGNSLLVEYGLNLNPLQKEDRFRPSIFFNNGGGAMQAVISKNPFAYGVTVEMQSNPTLAPNGWSASGMQVLPTNPDLLWAQEVGNQTKNFVRVEVRPD